MKKYEVSIVTPFHNVDLKFFQKGVQSMKNQTMGFENIEWIVVLHNCEKEYIDGVHALLDGYDNVVLAELKNECKTPSSPRNYGIDLATGKYIGFLDGDDSFLPDCLEKVTGYIKKNQTQIAVFRREYEMESKNSVPVTEIVLWDQTREEIVINRENWDDEKMFSGVFGMVTSRLYDLDFLNKYHIRFDESVLFGEDFLFNFEAYGKIESVVYLPQLIGYHYFINGGSLVQSGKKTPELLIKYAEGYKKIFDKGLENGFYVNSVISRLCVVLSKFLIACTEMTLEQRLEIKKILEPYINMTTLMTPSKIYPEKKVYETYEIPRRVILNLEDRNGKGLDDYIYMSDYTEQGIDVALVSLNEILNRNSNSDMGKRYGFTDIITMTGYQSRIPLSDYETYRPLIRLTTRIGESGIFTNDKIISYLERIESNGEVKQIPCTENSIKGFNQQFTQIADYGKAILFFECFQRDIIYNDSAYLTNVSGMVLDYYYQKKSVNYLGSPCFTSPVELLFPNKIENLNSLRMFYALKERDVRQIISSYTWIVLDAFATLENEWEAMCDAIETGNLPKTCCENEQLWMQLNDKLLPDPVRAAELREIFSKGFEEPVTPKIWPKLSRIVAMGTGCFQIYTDKLKRYIGDLTHVQGVCVVSESLVGQARENMQEFELVKTDIFYEFIDIDAPNEKPKLIKEIKVGKQYELVLTTKAGLYRYRTGEIIEITEVNSDKIYFCNLSYEKHNTKFELLDGSKHIFYERYIYQAIKAIEQQYEIEIADYIYKENASKKGQLNLTVYLEMPVQEKAYHKIQNMDKALIEQSLCEALQNIISLDIELGLEVIYLNPETQLLYREMLCFRNQLPEDQMRPLRKINDKREEDILGMLAEV